MAGPATNNWTSAPDSATAGFGDKDIAVADVTTTNATAGNYRITLDIDRSVLGFPSIAADLNPATVPTDNIVQILAKPSDHIVAYFEDTEGLVEGVNEAFYSNKIVVQEIGASARRTMAEATTDDTVAALEFGALSSHNALSTLGFDDASSQLTTNWVDDRDPAIKIGYDETEQRLTFDADNAQLGLGTGLGMNNFTIYSQTLDTGTNGLGIQAYGNNVDVSLSTNDKVDWKLVHQ